MAVINDSFLVKLGFEVVYFLLKTKKEKEWSLK